MREAHYLEKTIKPEADGAHSFKALRVFWPFIMCYKSHLFIAFFSLLLAALAVLGVGAGIRFLVDFGFSKSDPVWLFYTLGVLVLIIVVMAIASYLRLYHLSWLSERVVADLRQKLFDRLMHMHVGFFEVTPVGDIQSRLTTDSMLLQVLIGVALPVALRNGLIMAGGIAMLVVTSPKLAGIIGILIPVVLIPIIIMGKRVRKLSLNAQAESALVTFRLDESFSMIRTVYAFGQELKMQRQFTKQVNKTFWASMTRVKARATMASTVLVLVFSGVSLVMWLGGQAVMRHELTVGELSSFIFYAVAVAGSAATFSEIYGDLQRAAGAADRLLGYLQLEPEIVPLESGYTTSHIDGKVSFDNVEFIYPARPHHMALNGVSFEVNPGERVALVGPSGAGKSTIFSIIMRFYDPSSGDVYLDNQNLKNWQGFSFRYHIGLVPQDPMLFSGTIFDNIRFGSPNASIEQIEKAAKAAHAMEFIEKLPKGLDTLVGQKGVQLSGGQRQRLAIARALLRNPKILLLDEATSALDTRSEQEIQKALEKASSTRTTLIIAHRLSTVMSADRIILLDQGRVIDTGKHDELLKRSDLYRDLASRQLVSLGMDGLQS